MQAAKNSLATREYQCVPIITCYSCLLLPVALNVMCPVILNFVEHLCFFNAVY